MLYDKPVCPFDCIQCSGHGRQLGEHASLKAGNVIPWTGLVGYLRNRSSAFAALLSLGRRPERLLWGRKRAFASADVTGIEIRYDVLPQFHYPYDHRRNASPFCLRLSFKNIIKLRIKEMLSAQGDFSKACRFRFGP